MTYTFDDVKIGRQLIAEMGRHQWQLGDLALKVAPYTGPFSGGEILNRFADDIGVSPQMLGEYRRMANAWPQMARVAGAPYTLHRELATEPDRVAQLRTYVRYCQDNNKKPSLRGLQAYRGQTPTLEMTRANLEDQIRQGMSQIPPRIRAILIRDLLADADTAHCYATIIAGSLPPAGPPPVKQPAWRVLTRLCDRFASDTRRVLSEDSQLPPDEIRTITSAADRASLALTAMHAWIEAGGTAAGMDSMLDALLAAS